MVCHCFVSVLLMILHTCCRWNLHYASWIFHFACLLTFRFGQFLVSTLPGHTLNENELKLDAVTTTESSTDAGEGEETLSPRRICLRNVMLELILCLIYAEGGELDHR